MQEQVKETIDEKQDRLIAELTNNLREIKTGLENIYFNTIPSTSDPAITTKISEGYHLSTLINPSVANIDNNFSVEELDLLNKNFRLPSPSEILLQKYSNDDIDILKIIRKERNKLSSTKNVLNRKKKKSFQDTENIANIENTIFILNKYEKRVASIPEGNKILGRGIRKYKQPKRNAYKITGGSYGMVNINMPRLINEMVLEVLKHGQIVYEDKADKSLIDLLTKCFNPIKNTAIKQFKYSIT